MPRPKREFIGDQLGTGAKAAQKAVLAVTRPATQDDAVNGDAGEGEDVDHADVDSRGDHQRNRFIQPMPPGS
jgi:hypothetical protein